MNSRLNQLIRVSTFLTILMASRVGWSNAIDVYYTASGTSGNYLLNFTVVNNMTDNPTQNIYLFGVKLDNATIESSPTGFDPDIFTTWNNSPYGGSNIDYNAIWDDITATHFPGGSSPTSLSGFTVRVTDVALPAAVNWFAYSKSLSNTAYTGSGYFFIGGVNDSNVGFEGIFIHPTSVPEPSTLALISVSGIACGVWGFRRRRVRTGTEVPNENVNASGS